MKKKILIIRYGSLKYFIQSIPAFKAIREKHKDDELVLLTTPELKDFAKKLGIFDKFWIDNMLEWFMFNRFYKFIKLFRNYGFTRIYDLQNSDRTAWYFKLLGYYKPEWNSSNISWCSHYYEIPNDEIIHFQDVLARQLQVAGVSTKNKLDLSFLAKERNEDMPEKYALICAGGNKENKAHKFNPEKYAEIIKYLKSEHNITSIFIGSTHADAVVSSYIHSFTKEYEPVNMCGRTEIEDVVTLAKHAKFCLGNETAPTHIAAYSGCKTIMFCSRFSPADFIAPQVKNLAVIEEPFLENIDLDRIVDSIEGFALKEEKKKEYKEM